MTTRQYKVSITAPREVVWNSLWEDASYREWTSEFSPGSHAITDWKKGSKIHFLDGNNQGMFSRVADRKDNEFMSIQHLGMVVDGVEKPNEPGTGEWEGFENYTIRQVGNKSELTVDLQFGDVPQKYIDDFDQIFPKALNRLKQIAEEQAMEPTRVR
jgi:hypothetical protein